MSRLLVVGARPGSLGSAVAEQFSHDEVLTAGMTVHEDFQMDVTEPGSIRAVLEAVRPKDIVVTAGINVGEAVGQKGFLPALTRSMAVNVVGVMSILDEWVRLNGKGFDQERQAFVAISSNSAHIARRNSAAYCASKAALSMALRCAARELVGGPLVYGYELGLMRGTPMTAATEERFGPLQSRMLGAEKGLDPQDVAKVISNNLVHPWQGLNGSLLRLDAGEQ